MNPHVVHGRGPSGQTPLHGAPTVEIARYLLEHGADLDALDLEHESTPAQYMLRSTQTRHYPRDRQDVARALVAHGCRTDLLMAAALGDLALVRRHLDADPSSIRTSVSDRFFPRRDPRSSGTIYLDSLGKNRTAHTVARDFAHDDVFRLLVERSPLDLRLALACELGDEATFRELMAERPQLSATLTDEERIKVAEAAESNNTEAVRLMLAAGWPVDARGAFKATPLHWAAFHGNAAMVHEILRHHAPIDARGDEYDSPPIGWACFGSEHSWHRETGDYARAVQMLLDAGAAVPEMTEDSEATAIVREVIRRHR